MSQRPVNPTETERRSVIETRNLTKRYGNLIAVNNMTMKLGEGDVFGFIGPNGSGKTTTMRMIATLLNPDHGEAYVCGESIYTEQEKIRRLAFPPSDDTVVWVCGQPGLYTDLAGSRLKPLSPQSVLAKLGYTNEMVWRS